MRRGAALVAAMLLSGCLVGPDYQRAPPASPVAPEYKEAELPPGAASVFRLAQPRDAADRGPWWRVYGDPTLDGLAAQIDISNQNLKIFEANYRRARAIIRQDQSALYPNLSGTGSAQQTGTGGLRGAGSSSKPASAVALTASACYVTGPSGAAWR